VVSTAPIIFAEAAATSLLTMTAIQKNNTAVPVRRTCRKTHRSEVDNYCCECVGFCRVCFEQFNPKYLKKTKTLLDQTIRDKIEELSPDDPIDVLGEDAKDGEEEIELCSDCKRVWKQKKQERWWQPRWQGRIRRMR
jgi:hypothetical protein